LLGLLIDVILSHLNNFIGVKASKELLGHLVGAVLISVSFDLAGSSLLIAIKDDLLLLLGDLVAKLLLASTTLLKGLPEFLGLVVIFHLEGLLKVVFKIIELLHDLSSFVLIQVRSF